MLLCGRKTSIGACGSAFVILACVEVVLVNAGPFAAPVANARGDRYVRRKPLDRCRRRNRPVSLAVATDEAFNPIDVCLLGADPVVPKVDPIAHLIEQARETVALGLPCRQPLGGTN